MLTLSRVQGNVPQNAPVPASLMQPLPEDAAAIPDNRKPMSETEMRVRSKAQQGCDTAIYKIEHLNHQFQGCASLEDIKGLHFFARCLALRFTLKLAVIRAKCAIFVRLLSTSCAASTLFFFFTVSFARGFGSVSYREQGLVRASFAHIRRRNCR